MDASSRKRKRRGPYRRAEVGLKNNDKLILSMDDVYDDLTISMDDVYDDLTLSMDYDDLTLTIGDSEENVETNKSIASSSQNSTARTSPRKTSCKENQMSIDASCQRRSSPRKSPLVTIEYVKLVDKFEHEVKGYELMIMTEHAKKEKNPGYYLTRKLLPLLFSLEDMANSRGQGLQTPKQGDTRLPLDASKIRTIKAYSEGYCRKHQLRLATDPELNHAITEAVSCARKKLKKQNQ